MFKRRILIVDHDPTFARSVAEPLSERGYLVAEAYNGLSALEALYHEPFDLLVLNMVLPQRSGFAVLAQLRRSHRSSMPVIAVCGLVHGRYQELAKALGANDCVAKPFTVDRLLDAVEQRLDCTQWSPLPEPDEEASEVGPINGPRPAPRTAFPSPTPAGGPAVGAAQGRWKPRPAGS